MAIIPELLVAAPMLQDALIGKDGLPLAAGIVTCYQDDSRTTLKNWYYQSGTPLNYTWIPLPNPMTLSAAGTIEDANGNDVIPFFYPWFTSLDGSTDYQPYYITVYDRFGELQFTRANFPFDGSQINPTPGTEIYTLENLVTNNRFWRNIGSVNAGTIPLPSPNNTGIGYIQSGNFGTAYNNTPNPPNYYYITLAPNQNDGFSMPDFNYIKDAVGGTETISFLKFPATLTPVLGGNVMPEFYIEHVCGAQDSGVSIKTYQMPISLHLANLAGQDASFSIQARSNATGTNIRVALYKFQGTGNTSSTSIPFGIFPLTTSWEKWTANVTFPNNLSTTNSLTGDDAWYLQIQMPIDAPFSIDFTLPSLYLNPEQDIPTTSFESYDQIDRLISKPRTGDVRISINQFYPYGWLPMNDGTIGNNTTNPAPSILPSARNNIDAWPLYNLIWNLFSAYSTGTPTAGLNPIAPMFTTGTVSTQVGYGPNVTPPTTALDDWLAFKAISLTKAMGKVILGTVPITSLLAAYTITYNSAPSTITTTANVSFFNGMPVYIKGTPVPTGLLVNTIYYVSNFNGTNNFSLSTTFDDAIAGTPITIGTITGSTAVIVSALSGSSEGEYSHVQLPAEVGAHGHPGSVINGVGIGAVQSGTGSAVLIQTAATLGLTIATNTPNSAAANITQPGTFNNLYIKL